ncbi:MAG: hypothetical protein ACJ8FY_22660 [Gemmataceae bacterium]
MKSLDEIIEAVQRLDTAQFIRLRRKLDRLEAKIWQTEQTRVTAALAKKGITDEDIDRMVARRRREGRS